MTNKNLWADTLVEALFTAAEAPTVEEVPLPALGKSFYVRAADNDTRDRIDGVFGAAATGRGDRKGLRALVICGSLCDAQGRRMKFDDKLLAAIGGLDQTLTEPLYLAAMKVNRMWKEDAEQLEKNSATTSADEPGSS